MSAASIGDPVTFWQRLLSIFLADYRWFRRRIHGSWRKIQPDGTARALWLHEDQPCGRGVVWDVEFYPTHRR